MTTKKKNPNPIDVEFVELMSEQSGETPVTAPDVPASTEEPNELKIEWSPGVTNEERNKEFEPDLTKSTQWVEFIDEDNYRLLIDLHKIEAIEELADGFQDELFTKEELIEQPLWEKGVIVHFNIQNDEPIVMYGHDYDDIKELLINL